MKKKIALSPKVSRRVAALKPSGLEPFFDILAERSDIVSLGIGEPDFATPKVIRQTGIRSLEEGRTSYTSNAGLRDLRTALSKHLERLYGVHYDPDTEIILTVGVSEALYLALEAILNPDDEILVPTPCFVSYQGQVELADAVPVEVPMRAEDDFHPDIAALEKHLSPRTKAILINYPHNPTGVAGDRERLEAVLRFAEEHDLLVISDEIYDRLVYSVEHVCFPALPGAWERTILLGGFSKDYAMTGWRLGFAAAPAPILQALLRIHQYLIMAAPTTAQIAAVTALTDPESEKAVEEMRQAYERRRKLIVEGLRSIGLPTVEPKGAFYAFPDIRSTGLDDEAFAWRLLEEESVAVVPGSAFGPGGEGFVRCSYATSEENIAEALQRIERFVKKVRASG